MKRWLPVSLVTVALAVLIMALPASPSQAATASIPGDANNNNELTKAELSSFTLSYLSGSASLDDARDAAHVYAYWGGQPKTIVDSDLKTTTIYRPVKRIVALSTSGMEVLRTIKANDRVVGVSSYIIPEKADFYPEMTGIARVGTGAAPSYEDILALNPDLVIQSSTWTPEMEENFKGTNIAVVRLGFSTMNYTKEVAALGNLLDRQAEAKDANDFYQGYMDKITSRVSQVPDSEKPLVFLEWDPNYQTDTNASLAQLCTVVGGKNVAAGLTGKYPTVDAEWVLKQNPDVIIKFPYSKNSWDGYLAANSTDKMKDIAETVMSRTGLSEVSAVKNKKVFIVGQTIASGPRSLITMLYMAKWLYPEKFADIDPQAVHQEYITKYQGLSYDLSKQGAFVYAANAA